MNQNNLITVSVVIPSLNRATIVTRAVHSALKQTLKSIEVIVVVDGPDEETVTELKKINDPRLRIKPLPINVGCADSRNAGVDDAQGKWIAFLDDDDEWLPNKLECQLAAAEKSSSLFPVIASRFIEKTPKEDFILPKRLPEPEEDISEFLFVRKSLVERAESIQTSTFFTTKDLLKKVPFTKKLRKHVDWDWLIRASNFNGVKIEVIPEVLAIRFYDDDREAISSIKNWKFSRDWIRSVKDLVTPKAYSGFLLRVANRQASMNREWQAFFPLLFEAVNNGKPRFKDCLSFILVWFIPLELRRQLRYLMTRKASNTV
ncbi:MAG: glycosyltransferase family 2 protein [Xenococcus sp. MO_188.B8]|nr:glycosyltransferase family 2 protein [Xenococcus sp. MO_188.B8]